MGIVAMPAMLAPILGPVVGGAILQSLHWSWIFLVNVPIGVVAFVLGWRMLPAAPNPARPGASTCSVWRCSRRRRPRSSTASSSSAPPTPASTAPIVLVPILAGSLLTGAFCWHALRVERPLLDIRLYENRDLRGRRRSRRSALGAALFGAMILVPLYYQEVRHESLIATGLLVGPQGLGMLVAMPLAGRLTDRFGGGRVALVGVSVLCLGTIPLAFIGASTSIVAISHGAARARRRHRLLVHAGDDRRVRLAAPRAALRRDAAAERAPAHRRRDRDGGARGGAAARRRPRALRPHLAQRLQHRLLVVARDRRARR